MVIVVWTLAAFELYIAISFAVSKSVRPSRLATEPVWSTAMMRRVADARSKFAAAKRNEGAHASLRLTAGNLGRLAAIGLGHHLLGKHVNCTVPMRGVGWILADSWAGESRLGLVPEPPLLELLAGAAGGGVVLLGAGRRHVGWRR